MSIQICRQAVITITDRRNTHTYSHTMAAKCAEQWIHFGHLDGTEHDSNNYNSTIDVRNIIRLYNNIVLRAYPYYHNREAFLLARSLVCSRSKYGAVGINHQCVQDFLHEKKINKLIRYASSHTNTNVPLTSFGHVTDTT